jgi:hypothetical protein
VRLPLTAKTKKTVKTLLTLTTDCYKALEKKARETFGDRQGYLSMYVEMIIRNHLGLASEHVEEA